MPTTKTRTTFGECAEAPKMEAYASRSSQLNPSFTMNDPTNIIHESNQEGLTEVGSTFENLCSIDGLNYKYYTETEFASELATHKGLSFMHLNIASLSKHFDTLVLNKLFVPAAPKLVCKLPSTITRKLQSPSIRSHTSSILVWIKRTTSLCSFIWNGFNVVAGIVNETILVFWLPISLWK